MKKDDADKDPSPLPRNTCHPCGRWKHEQEPACGVCSRITRVLAAAEWAERTLEIFGDSLTPEQEKKLKALAKRARYSRQEVGYAPGERGGTVK